MGTSKISRVENLSPEKQVHSIFSSSTFVVHIITVGETKGEEETKGLSEREKNAQEKEKLKEKFDEEYLLFS